MKKKQGEAKGKYTCHKCGFQSDMPLKGHDCGPGYCSIEDYHHGNASWSSLHPIDRKILEEQS